MNQSRNSETSKVHKHSNEEIHRLKSSVSALKRELRKFSTKETQKTKKYLECVEGVKNKYREKIERLRERIRELQLEADRLSYELDAANRKLRQDE